MDSKLCLQFLIYDDETEFLDRLPENIETNNIVTFNYAAINSISMNLYFSVYKDILSDCRRLFEIQNISEF